MTCKYFDSGWCYAPENVKNNSVQGACIEPEYCPYKKSQMTNQQPLDIIEIGGVKYQRIEEPKPKTLLEIIREWNYDEDYLTDEELVNRIERKWLPDEMIEDGEDYNIGWNDCLQHLKDNLK